MTNYEYGLICKCFQKLEVDNANQLVGLENTYQIFHRFDEFDFLSLLECKIYKNALDDIQNKVLSLCDYLVKYNNKEP